MALFSLLLKEGIYFEVAHMNYHMREESNIEEERLFAFCNENNIIFHSKSVFFDKKSGNFQAWARRTRYQFFESVVIERHLDFVLTAHHLDDVFETYLMQKELNKNLFHYGIKEDSLISSIRVLRPLLTYSKKDLLDIVNKGNIPFSIDKSNLESKYKRNYYRNKVLVNMSEDDKKALLLEIESRNEFESKLTADVLPLINNCNVVEIVKYQALTTDHKKRLIYVLFTRLSAGDLFSGRLFTQINEALLSDKTSQLFKLKEHIYFSKFYGEFTLINITQFESYRISIKREDTHIKTKHVDFDLTGDLSRYNISKNNFPLTIRTIKKFDRYQIKDYQKSVSRLFIDMKMPKHIRLIWPLIESNDGKIIYIPRYRKNYIFKQSDKLQVLW